MPSFLQHFVTFILSFLQVKMKKPILKGTQVEIVRSGQFYTLLLGKHISISWDTGSRLLVHISASYRVSQSNFFFCLHFLFVFISLHIVSDKQGRVCGLCGNFDGNLNNDMISSNNQLEVDSSHFGNSWKVVPSCADVTQVHSCLVAKLATSVISQSSLFLPGLIFATCLLVCILAFVNSVLLHNLKGGFLSSSVGLFVDLELNIYKDCMICVKCSYICLMVQIPVPCSDNIVRLVTVEQSCRVITGSLFKECNSEVTCITAFRLFIPKVRVPVHPLLSRGKFRSTQSRTWRCAWKQRALVRQWGTARASVMSSQPMHRLVPRGACLWPGDPMTSAVRAAVVAT